jgi:hypothetical protein
MDFESTTLNKFTLAVKARDFATQSQEGKSSLVASATCSIVVTDANEAPWFPKNSDYTRTIPERAAKNTIVGGGAGVLAVDQDAGDDARLTYSLDAVSSSPHFAIDSATGIISVSVDGDSIFDYEDDAQRINGFDVTVVAADAGTQGDGVNPLTASVTVNIQLTDLNEAPILEDTRLKVPETTLLGASIGGAIKAIDYDLSGGQDLTFSIKPGYAWGGNTMNTTNTLRPWDDEQGASGAWMTKGIWAESRVFSTADGSKSKCSHDASVACTEDSGCTGDEGAHRAFGVGAGPGAKGGCRHFGLG